MKYLKRMNEAQVDASGNITGTGGAPTPPADLLKLHKKIVGFNNLIDDGISQGTELSETYDVWFEKFLETKMDLEQMADAPSEHEALYYVDVDGEEIFVYILNYKFYKIYNPSKIELPFKIGDEVNYELSEHSKTPALLPSISVDDEEYDSWGIMEYVLEGGVEILKAYEILVKGKPFTQF
jgi:hypothetical protein